MSNFIKNKDKILNTLHITGFILLIIVTGYGILQLRGEDFSGFKEIITNRWRLFLIACVLRFLDWILDYYLWRLLLNKFSNNIPIRESIWIYLTQGAGIVLPAQLGRALRGYVISKTGEVSVSKAMTLEFLFLLCVTEGAFLVLLVSLAFYANHFILPLIIAVASLLVFPFLLKILAPLFSKIKIHLNNDIIKPEFLILFCIGCSVGWAVNGLIFFLLLGSRSSGLYLSQVEMILLGNLFLGICSGIPGGMGIVETTMGISLHWLQVQLPEIIVVIGLFRIITFWIWIPLGWLALLRLKLYRQIFLKENSYES